MVKEEIMLVCAAAFEKPRAVSNLTSLAFVFCFKLTATSCFKLTATSCRNGKMPACQIGTDLPGPNTSGWQWKKKVKMLSQRAVLTCGRTVSQKPRFDYCTPQCDSHNMTGVVFVDFHLPDS